MARALVTGIGGFAGSHLAEHLLEEGDEVAGIVRPGDPVPNLDALRGRLRLATADVGDPLALERALAGAAPDHVYHLAGFASPRLSFEDPLACHRVNVLGTAALFEALRRAGARPAVLVVSSAEVYGRAGGAPIREDAPLRPISPYGASKASAEMVALAAAAADGARAVIARAFNHLGARQEPVFAAPAFAKQVAEAEVGKGPREIRVGNLAPVRDLGDVRDTVRAYRLLAQRGEAGEAYNVATGRGTTMRAFLDRLVALARVPLTVIEDPALYRAADIDCLLGDPARLEAATGFRPGRLLDETVASVLGYWRARVG